MKIYRITAKTLLTLLATASTVQVVQAQKLGENVILAAPEPIVSPPVPDTGPAPTTLRDAIVKAYGEYPQLAAQRASVQATDEQYVQARSAYGPQLSAQGAYGYQYDRTEVGTNLASESDGFAFDATAALSQPIYSTGRNYYGVKLSEANIGLSRQTLRAVEADLLFNVISAYVGVRRDSELVRISRENVDLLSTQNANIERRFSLRESTRTDFAQTGTRLSLAEGQLAEALGQLQVSRGQYLQFVGQIPGELAPLPELPNIPTTIDSAYATALRNNPNILAAEYRECASRAAVELARAEFGPNVSLNGSANFGGVTPYSNRFDRRGARAEVVVAVPIYQSGFRSSRVREQEALHNADVHQLDQIRRDTIQSIDESWETLVSRRDSTDKYLAAVTSARVAYDGAIQQERAGFITLLDVLDLARDLLTAQSNYTVALSNEYLARASLLSAMGMLEAPILYEDIERYDPTENFDRVRRRGDLPWTPVLHALDGITAIDLERAMETPDPAAALAKDAAPAPVEDQNGP